ncbi:SDR family oxidoreductase [Iodobacter sp. HSC-16F04]|uniref:SDR family oxidoreductase n=1 Tax=Iodobacter violaceini TaxID=3044271 RepID=A0ABX0KWY4_9NEIS|nr:SDR family oxidoreductase [Iodobacter violacea]NHQ84708.1 SDR family oxidoreductase [Iodobacter violacea]
MNILLLGNGLIGSHLRDALLMRGHQVRLLSRRALANPEYKVVQGDFAALQSSADWLPLLDGIDTVINTVGIFAESAGQSFTALHHAAPQALFAACETGKVQKVIHLSALGAGANAPTACLRSKGLGDAALMQSTLNWTIVRPSLIYAPDGASSRAFCSIASLPLLPDLQGVGKVQPVHLHDVLALLIRVVERPVAQQQIINAVGPQAMPLTTWWQQLRQGMGMARAITLPIAACLQNIAAKSAMLPLFQPDSLIMLRSGNCSDAAPFAAILGRAPQAAAPVNGSARDALLGWLLPLLKLSMALVWLGTAAVCLWAWPRADSYQLLADVGIPGAWQPLLFYGSVAMDSVFGLLCLLDLQGVQARSWRLQWLLVLAYSIIIAIRLPQFLWHPFGPLLKNLPIMALLLMLDLLSPSKTKPNS